MLLVMGSETFPKDNHHDRNFVMIDEVPNSNPPKKSKAPIAIFLGLAMITTQIAPGAACQQHTWLKHLALQLTVCCTRFDCSVCAVSDQAGDPTQAEGTHCAGTR